MGVRCGCALALNVWESSKLDSRAEGSSGGSYKLGDEHFFLFSRTFSLLNLLNCSQIFIEFAQFTHTPILLLKITLKRKERCMAR